MDDTQGSPRPTGAWLKIGGQAPHQCTIAVENLAPWRKSLALTIHVAGEDETKIVAYFVSDEMADTFVKVMGRKL